jgi:hypothetical protein
MNHAQFPDHVMFCNSTGNQTINLIPAVQFGIGKTVIISTDYTEKGLTKKLTASLIKRGIESHVEKISPDEEKNIKALTDKLIDLSRKYGKIVWNISGGQKIPTVGLHNAFYRRIEAGFSDDLVLYVEGTDPAIWYYGKDFINKKVRNHVALSLDEQLDLFNSYTRDNASVLIYPKCTQQTTDRLETGLRALSFYLNSAIFREAFFSLMTPPEQLPRSKGDLRAQIKAVLNENKPDFSIVRLRKTGYEDLEESFGAAIKIIENTNSMAAAKDAIKKIRLVGRPKDIYEDYWTSIKNLCVEKVLEQMDNKSFPLLSHSITVSERLEFETQIVALGGQMECSGSDCLLNNNIKRFSSNGGNAELFEWMVASSVVDSIRRNPEIAECISQVHCNVKTWIGDSAHLKNDAEIDVLITTQYGTLIVLEAKTYNFSGDTAKSKESIAYKKSGPFAKAIIIGPLIRSIVEEKKDGTIEAPQYIPDKTRDQPVTARQSGIEYCYLDEIEKMLRKQLSLEKR